MAKGGMRGRVLGAVEISDHLSEPTSGVERRPPGPERPRPRQVTLSVGIFAAFWAGALVVVGALVLPGGEGGDAAIFFGGYGFWTVVAALLLWRVWVGGAQATATMALVGMGFGAVLAPLVVVAGLVALVASTDLPLSMRPLLLVPGALASSMLFTAGFLLIRKPVRDWVR